MDVGGGGKRLVVQRMAYHNRRSVLNLFDEGGRGRKELVVQRIAYISRRGVHDKKTSIPHLLYML